MSHATLYHGSASDAADVLESDGEHGDCNRGEARMRAALINALRRIERLEMRVLNLRRDTRNHPKGCECRDCRGTYPEDLQE